MSKQEFLPDWASAPGDTVSDILQERNLTESEFAQLIGYTLQFTMDLLQGRAAVTLAVARRLTQFLGGSVEFWMSRDFQFRQDSARQNAARVE